MSTRVLISTLAAAALLATSAFAQQTYKAPRTSDGRPNINGIWQAMNTADWDLRAHAASQGPLLSLGAEFSVPPGPGVIDGDGTIPYLPASAEQQKKNFANRLTLGPGSEVLHGRRAAVHLHAVSLPDYPVAARDHDRL